MKFAPVQNMILALDTFYYETKGKTVCIGFSNWKDVSESFKYEEITEVTEPYKSGEFYKRELPCILSLLRKVPLQNIIAIIVDGFVFLDDKEKPGLGGRLYECLDHRFPVIGVAKSYFATIHSLERELYRGNSVKPLYVTSIGIGVDKATKLIKSMAGNDRIPLLLKRLDRLTREN